MWRSQENVESMIVTLLSATASSPLKLVRVIDEPIYLLEKCAEKCFGTIFKPHCLQHIEKKTKRIIEQFTNLVSHAACASSA